MVSVVLPMLNAEKHVDNLISSLFRQDFAEPWEIIAVDNGSDDRTVQIATALLTSDPPPNLVRGEVVFEPKPRGYASPRNAGARLALAPLLVFCDSDGAVDERWLRMLVRSLETHSLVSSHKYRTYDVALRDVGSVLFDQRQMGSMFGFPFVSSAGLGCTRELFDFLGGFDPHFDFGAEDVDFSFRARFRCGVEPILEPNAIYWTTVPSRVVASFKRGFRDGRSELRVYQRHLGEISRVRSGEGKPSRPLGRPRGGIRRVISLNRYQTASLAHGLGRRVGLAVWSIKIKRRAS